MTNNSLISKAINSPDAIAVAKQLSNRVEPIVESILQGTDCREVLRQLDQLEEALNIISLKIRASVDSHFSVDLQMVKQEVLVNISRCLASVFDNPKMYVVDGGNSSDMIRELAEQHHLDVSDALCILFEAKCNQEIRETIRDPHFAKIRMDNICFCEQHYGLDASTYKRLVWKTAITYWQKIVQEDTARGGEASFTLRNILTFFPEGGSDMSLLHQCEDEYFAQLLTSLEEAVQEVLEAKHSSPCHFCDNDLIWKTISILRKLNKFHLIGADRESFLPAAIEKAINEVLKKYDLDISFFSSFEQSQNYMEQLRREAERSTIPVGTIKSFHDVISDTRKQALELLV